MTQSGLMPRGEIETITTQMVAVAQEARERVETEAEVEGAAARAATDDLESRAPRLGGERSSTADKERYDAPLPFDWRAWKAEMAF